MKQMERYQSYLRSNGNLRKPITETADLLFNQGSNQSRDPSRLKLDFNDFSLYNDSFISPQVEKDERLIKLHDSVLQVSSNGYEEVGSSGTVTEYLSAPKGYTRIECPQVQGFGTADSKETLRAGPKKSP